MVGIGVDLYVEIKSIREIYNSGFKHLIHRITLIPKHLIFSKNPSA